MPRFVSPSFRRRAFTLIELIIVVMVIAIASALALPMIGDDDSTRLREAARLLTADLAAAQIESITHGDAPRVVVFDQATDGYHLATRASPATPITNPIGKVPYRVIYGHGTASLLTGVQVASLSLNGDSTLGFGLYGQLDQTSNATITLACGSRTVTITVNTTTGEASVGAMH